MLTLYRQPAAQLQEVRDGSVALVFSGPPYFPEDTMNWLYGRNTRRMTESEVMQRITAFAQNDVGEVLRSCARVLRPGGHVVLQTRDVRVKHTLLAVEHWHRAALEETGLILIAKHLWRQPGYSLSKLRTQKSFLQQLGPQPIVPESFLVFKKTGTALFGEPSEEAWNLLLSDFMRVPSENLSARHPYQTPLPICRAMIETYSQPGDVVLDPFAGGGSTAVCALDLGRDAILYEKDPVALTLLEKNLKRFLP